ncbi:GNAT family N-acetyltransferase [Clostridium amazonitimonense]|uniref:GNAT family N-acetyltransferase n=1 Tax=Clostridium amazonitimonense TaxID=1499689 RepID=UPI0005098474|nr:GNAT family N-acetyltransferase [Clostridium amazonitimonense]
MNIKVCKELKDDIISEIRKIEEICNARDNLKINTFLDNSMNFNKEINNLFLAYEGDKLVSFLNIFMPTSKEGEISACTLPEYRKKGYFKSLFNKALQELYKYRVEDVLLVVEENSEVGKTIAINLGAKYDFSEYLLKFNGDMNLHLKVPDKIKILEAKAEHLEDMTKLAQCIFNRDYEESKIMVNNAFETQNRTQYIIKLEKNIIGMAGVSFEDGDGYIFGLGISPDYRGKGYSKMLLNEIIKDTYINHTKNIVLEVDSNNKIAFNLYTKNGFIIDNAFHYYRKSCKDN